MEHFGVKLMNKGKSFKLTRDEFALINTKPSLPFFSDLANQNAYADKEGNSYSEEWCIKYRELCLKNYDLHMEFYSKLSKTEFDKSLEAFIKQHKCFQEVTDLNNYAQTEGYYIMVLDEYRQVYIGKTNDIKKRIMQHWSNTKPFDRTLFPMYAYKTSCFSIDFFRALDTTRIFAWDAKISDEMEAKLIRNFPAQFYTNRIGGGITTPIQALATMHKRQL